MGKKKSSSAEKPSTIDVVQSSAKSQMRVKYVNHPYSWVNVLLSPEVLLSIVCVGFSTYLLVALPTDMFVERLWQLTKAKNSFRLENRENERSIGVPTFIVADYVAWILGCMSVCFFLSSCCRVIMKAQNKFNREVLEEALRAHYDEAAREAKKAIDNKQLEEENATRAKKGFKPLKPYIQCEHICGDAVLITLVAIMCIIFSVVLIIFVLIAPLNQVRGLGILSVFSVLVGGLVFPKVFDDLLTLQHYCGVMQNFFCLGLLVLCYISMTNL